MNCALQWATIVRAAILATAVLAAAANQALADEPAPTWKGLKVFPKVGAKIKIDNATIDYGSGRISFPWVVQDTKGDLLLIGSQRKAWIEQSQVVTLAEAPAYYSQFTRLYGYETWAYTMRAFVLQEKGDLLAAIADYDVGIRLNADTWSYVSRGRAWDSKKDHAKALADFDQAIRINPNFSLAYNNAAWLLATCANEHFRDGRRAIEMATKACELTDWEDASYLDTLAAAYAETGDFESAVKHQTKALEFEPTNDELLEHAALFENHQPYHEK
jgi:tetratricopeptide (TPR) repeat protein